MNSIKHRITPSMRASIRDAISWAIMMGTGEAFLAPLGVYMEGSPAQIGILITVPLLFAAWAQFAAVKIIEKFRVRKPVVVAGAILQALLWIPIMLVPHGLEKGPASVNVLLGLLVLYFAAGHFTVPGWNSIMGDMVPEDIRGRYFGLRNKLGGLTMLAALIFSSLFVHWGEKIEMQATFFSILFSVALIARLASSYWLSKHDEKVLPREKEYDEFSLFKFIKKAPKSNFAKYVFFFACFQFCLNLGGPFLSVYMIRELHFSYAELMASTAIILGVQFMMMQNWGRISDSFGNKKVLTFCCIGICFLPFFWLTFSQFWHVAAFHVFAGFLFAGFNLAAGNYLFDAVTPEKRARCTSFLWIISATFMAAGSLIGGQAINFLEANPDILTVSWLPSSPYMFMMLISALARMVTVAVFIPAFRELRNVEDISHTQIFFRVTNLRTIHGARFGLAAIAAKKTYHNKLFIAALRTYRNVRQRWQDTEHKKAA